MMRRAYQRSINVSRALGWEAVLGWLPGAVVVAPDELYTMAEKSMSAVKRGVWCEVLAIALLVGCGGGGGGSGDGAGGGGGGGSTETGIRVLHAAVDAPPVEIVAGGEATVVQVARFAEAVGYEELSTGAQEVSLRRVGDVAGTVGAFAVTVARNERRSVLLFGEEETGLQTALLGDEPGEIPADKAVVRVVNGIASARAVAVTLGDAEAALDLDLGASSLYVPVSPGSTTVTVRDSSRPIFAGARALEAGRAYTLLLAGERGYFITATLLPDR